MSKLPFSFSFKTGSYFSSSSVSSRITLQGLPTAITLAGISFVTTLPPPMMLLSPIETPGSITTFPPIPDVNVHYRYRISDIPNRLYAVPHLQHARPYKYSHSAPIIHCLLNVTKASSNIVHPYWHKNSHQHGCYSHNRNGTAVR